MRDAGFSQESAEVGAWSEPLVADRIFGAYEQLFGGRTEGSEALGRQHCRMWRNLLAPGAQVHAQFARRELIKLARRAQLRDSDVERIDAAILADLLNLILRRGHGSIDSARSDGMALVQAASTLGEIRRVA